MRTLILSIISMFLFSSMAVADNGLVSVKSSHPVKETADRLENILQKKGMTLFTRINHSAGAEKVGKELRPTELIIFGNPKVGAPLMQCSQTMAIDLPQKALIWEDETGQVWFSYNEPEYLAKRHNTQGCLEVIKKVQNVLANFASAATAP
ncbi:MAG: DUF302 domain-containing protein [Bacteroidetes bacterium]|nr:DUF302 domain-containing protein [Pseudomonadota bacterium]MBU1061018.1 DUF302 domain-containing protein [Pseudomonadota bacterium]MBU1800604.1 DUF302 domain-containing protein [Bacteroidota bacterium]